LGARVPVIIDGGASPRDAASTIVDLSGEFGRTWHIQREGAIPAAEIAKALGGEAQSAG
jgi:tRNA A37 threonylcarbamoyladenosine synthetase subunit TsaC/SUA5/YrdC